MPRLTKYCSLALANFFPPPRDVLSPNPSSGGLVENPVCSYVIYYVIKIILPVDTDSYQGFLCIAKFSDSYWVNTNLFMLTKYLNSDVRYLPT